LSENKKNSKREEASSLEPSRRANGVDERMGRRTTEEVITWSTSTRGATIRQVERKDQRGLEKEQQNENIPDFISQGDGRKEDRGNITEESGGGERLPAGRKINHRDRKCREKIRRKREPKPRNDLTVDPLRAKRLRFSLIVNRTQ